MFNDRYQEPVLSTGSRTLQERNPREMSAFDCREVAEGEFKESGLLLDRLIGSGNLLCCQARAT
jgi:hypothetical protein